MIRFHITYPRTRPRTHHFMSLPINRRNRRYAHFITRTKNDQFSVDGAKLNGNLKAEVPYKSMGSKCGSSNNSPLELRAGHLACHCKRSVWQARWPALSSSGELLLEPHLLPILLYGTSAFKLPLSFAPSTLN